MFNFYLYNSSFEGESIKNIENSFICLNTIAVENVDEKEIYLMHNSLYTVQIELGIDFAQGIFSCINKEFISHALPILLHRIKTVKNPIQSLEDFDKDYQQYNAFYGIRFEDENLRYITSIEEYEKFKKASILDITPENLWEKRLSIFKRLYFCNSVRKNIEDLGQSKYFAQVITRLLELDRYVDTNWNHGSFNYKDANKNSSLNISPESVSTMRNSTLKNKRIFSLPSGVSVCFELHIKTGDLRFHFYPVNKMVWIGYIGPHLPI